MVCSDALILRQDEPPPKIIPGRGLYVIPIVKGPALRELADRRREEKAKRIRSLLAIAQCQDVVMREKAS